MIKEDHRLLDYITYGMERGAGNVTYTGIFKNLDPLGTVMAIDLLTACFAGNGLRCENVPSSRNEQTQTVLTLKFSPHVFEDVFKTAREIETAARTSKLADPFDLIRNFNALPGQSGGTQAELA